MPEKRPQECQDNRGVLVLDDQPLVLKTIAAALGRSGFRVFTAATADKAHQLFLTHAHLLCVVIVDIALAEMTGVEFVESLPTLQPRVPVLFITGSRDLEEILPPNSLVLHKPFNVASLLQLIRAAVLSTSASASP